jgi:hypothetical protein
LAPVAAAVPAPESRLNASFRPLEEVADGVPHAAWDRFFATYGDDFRVFIDTRSGSSASVIGHVPLIPGTGADNRMTREDLEARLGRPVDAVDAEVVVDAHGGQVLGFRDLSHRFSDRYVDGGAYPLVNTDVCPTGAPSVLPWSDPSAPDGERAHPRGDRSEPPARRMRLHDDHQEMISPGHTVPRKTVPGSPETQPARRPT